jgi:hypothetical protein
VLGIVVRMHLNASPNLNSNPRRLGRLMARSLQAASFAVEDITAPEHLTHEVGVNEVLHDSETSEGDASQPPIRQTAVRRGSMTMKNGNWTNEQFSSAIATHDSGMSMKKASETFNISYSSFREHCYGMRKSRKRGVKGVLTLHEEQQLSDWLLSMVERGYGLSPIALRMKVSEITMSRATPLTEGILGRGWMRGWKGDIQS